MRVLIVLTVVCLGSLRAETGGITGTVPLPKNQPASIPVKEYRGKISGKVSPPPKQIAAVWLEAPTLAAPKKPAPVSFAQENYQFAKALIIIPRGTTVSFPNHDPDYHNVYSLSRAKRFDIGRYKTGEEPTPSIVFDRSGFVALRCEIHEHMNANIIVVDSPHFSTTGTDGTFRLAGIPAGSYTLHAQISRKISWQTPVQVPARKTIRINFPIK